MPLTNDTLTLWELGHRMVGEHPDRWRPLGVSLSVRDNFRLLLNEILSAHLESTLIMTKWHSGLQSSPDMHIRHHLETINDCIHRGNCQKNFLKSVGVERWEFRQWCQQTGYPLPDFWYAFDYQRPPEEEGWEDDMTDESVEDLEDVLPEQSKRLRVQAKRRITCQQIATKLWEEHPGMTISAMSDHESIMEIAGNYTKKTRQKWLRDVAPKNVREKRGRPRKDNSIKDQ